MSLGLDLRFRDATPIEIKVLFTLVGRCVLKAIWIRLSLTYVSSKDIPSSRLAFTFNLSVYQCCVVGPLSGTLSYSGQIIVCVN